MTAESSNLGLSKKTNDTNDAAGSLNWEERVAEARRKRLAILAEREKSGGTDADAAPIIGPKPWDVVDQKFPPMEETKDVSAESDAAPEVKPIIAPVQEKIIPEKTKSTQIKTTDGIGLSALTAAVASVEVKDDVVKPVTIPQDLVLKPQAARDQKSRKPVAALLAASVAAAAITLAYGMSGPNDADPNGLEIANGETGAGTAPNADDALSTVASLDAKIPQQSAPASQNDPTPGVTVISDLDTVPIIAGLSDNSGGDVTLPTDVATNATPKGLPETLTNVAPTSIAMSGLSGLDVVPDMPQVSEQAVQTPGVLELAAALPSLTKPTLGNVSSPEPTAFVPPSSPALPYEPEIVAAVSGAAPALAYSNTVGFYVADAPLTPPSINNLALQSVATPTSFAAFDIPQPRLDIAKPTENLSRFNVLFHVPSAVPKESFSDRLAQLQDGGLDLTDPVRVDFKVSKDQVRFFHQEDATTAFLVADLIGAEARDFTSFSPSPPAGQLEVFVAGESSAPIRRAPTAKPRAQKRQKTDPAAGLRERLARRMQRGDHL